MDVNNRFPAINRPQSKTVQRVRRTIHNLIAFVLTFCVCFATWIVLSGRFDFFHLSLGIIASTIIALFSGTLLISVEGIEKLPGQWLRFLMYIPWLLYQVMIANMHVMYLVFHPRVMELIEPKIIRFPSKLKKPMALFIFANSITLTPGTITVYVSIDGEFTVHVIDTASGTDLPGEMEKRVADLMGE